MRILIDGQTLLTPEINRGIGIYFKNSVENILASDFTNDFYINTPLGAHLNSLSPWARAKLCIIDDPAYDIRAVHQRGREYSAELYSSALNDDIEERGIDLYWSPNALMDNVVLPAGKASGCQFAVTIFDLIILVMAKEYAKHRSPSARAAYKKKLHLLERDYDLFLHISRHTQSDFTRMLQVETKRHVVTPLAADSSFRPYPFPEFAGANDYVVYTGGFDPRKNMDRALEAFARLQKRYVGDQNISATQLFIVCGLDDEAKSRMLRRVDRLGLTGKVRLTGFIDNDDLRALYQRARCLFFPSLYEGFGLPLLEGLACGLPVASSNTSSLPEVGGELAIYFDPYNIDEMADSLYQALRAPMDYQARQRRYEYSKQFSWPETARATLKAFADCVGDAQRKRVAVSAGVDHE
ncbi:MAG TPA: glycosyltransferase family 1 protein [Pyrinomonadaceae bacterium]|nr:glycosyltransferase family 1 protein [Pyrinomonadaceae bacterium]